VLVDGGAATHLVGGDEPFVATGEEVVGELAPVDPPGIAIDAEAHETALDEATEIIVGEGRGQWSYPLGAPRTVRSGLPVGEGAAEAILPSLDMRPAAMRR